MGRNKCSVMFERPKVDYKTFSRLWFQHAGIAYSVASAPTSVFKAAVLKRAPTWKMHAVYGPLILPDELDLVTKWYLLNELASSGLGIVLYERE